MKKYTILNYSAMFKKEPEGGYTVKIPSLPGCITYGKTMEKAKKMATDAIHVYIASLHKHGEPIPSDESIFITTLTIPIHDSGKKLYV